VANRAEMKNVIEREKKNIQTGEVNFLLHNALPWESFRTEN